MSGLQAPYGRCGPRGVHNAKRRVAAMGAAAWGFATMRVVAFVGAVLIVDAARVSAAEPVYRARTQNGVSMSGALAMSDDGRLELRCEDGRRVSWEMIQRLEPERGAFAAPPRPLRRVALRGGDAIAAAIVGGSEQRLSTFAVAGRLEIPWSAIDTLDALPGERTLLYESGASRPEGWVAEAGAIDVTSTDRITAARDEEEVRAALVLKAGSRLRLPPLPAWNAGRLQLCDEPRAGRSSDESSGRWAVEFELKPNGDSESRKTLRLVVDRGAAAPVLESDPPGRFAHQPLREWKPTAANAGRRSLTVLLSPGRVQLCVDGHLRADGRAPEGTVVAIRLRADPPVERRSNEVNGGAIKSEVARISHVHVVAHEPSARPLDPLSDRRGDVLRLRAGDELFGALRAVDADGVACEASGKVVRADWLDVDRLGVAARRGEWNAVSGAVAKVVLAAPTDRPPRADDAYGTLVGAVTRLDERSVDLDHPALGSIRLPLVAIQRIEPRYFGDQQVVDPDVHHFGTAVRPAFQRPLPDGTRRTFEFTATPPAAGARAAVALTVRDLEPSGPDAPPGTPFLAELRAGGLLTEVWLNDTPLGDLNSRIRHKRAVDSDQTIRLDIPPEAWKAGRNTLRIEQRPARHDKTSYDDCELGPIRIETRR